MGGRLGILRFHATVFFYRTDGKTRKRKRNFELVGFPEIRSMIGILKFFFHLGIEKYSVIRDLSGINSGVWWILPSKKK